MIRLRFIDVNNGNVYNGDKPYVHWFGGKQSIGLNYDKQFIVLVDANRIEVHTNGDVFYLVDTCKIDKYIQHNEGNIEREFNDKHYLNLDDIKTTCYKCDGSEDAKIGNFYIYSFNIIAQGKYVGEITDTFTINGKEFTIGADFIDENESLGINLANFGVDISNEVQRAIYEAPLDEQKTDYTLINRKFKELLNEYINVLGNKGSYKSLINSLNWFEYGDIVKLYEYWKHKEPNKNYLSKRDITQFVNEYTEELLYSNAKTTYIGISAALEKIAMKEGEIMYEDKYNEQYGNDPQMVDEPNPDLEKVTMLWSKEEMSLKMVLLGNFFATYFLPIHLDLIHCTIENIVYANTIKIPVLPRLERVDILDNIYDFKCAVDKLYHLSNIETFTNLRTPFGYNHKTNLDESDDVLEILGVDTQFDRTYPIGTTGQRDDKSKAYNFQHFKGIGVLVPIKCTLYNVSEGAVITEGSIKLHKYHIEGTDIVIDHTIERESDNIEHMPIENKVKIEFNLLVREIGNYKLQLSFRRSDSVLYIKTLDFKVDGEVHPLLSMYKIVPRYSEIELKSFGIKKWIDRDTDINDGGSLPFEHIADYVFDPIQYKLKLKEDRTIYTQFISATRENIYNTIHTNQVFIIEGTADPNSKLGISYDSIRGVYISKSNAGSLKISLADVIANINEDTGRYDINQNPTNLFTNQFAHTTNDDEQNTSDTPTYTPILNPNDIVWFTMDRGGNFVDPSDNSSISEWTMVDDRIYLIGICTTPNIEKSPKYPSYKIVENTNHNKLWLRDMFIPYFYKLEPFGEISDFDVIAKDLSQEDVFKIRNASNTYTLNKTDVVCFLPKLRCVRRPKDFMWKYICKTNNTEITPILFRSGDMAYDEEGHVLPKLTPNDNQHTAKTPFPTILQPLFGRYDFSILPSIGYYDIIFNYKMDDAEEENQTKTISSEFIISK